MGETLVATGLMLVGLACIGAWAVCRWVAAVRLERLRREADVIKLHVVQGGRLPDKTASILARDYMELQWLDMVGNMLLLPGIAGLLISHLLIF